MKTREREDGKTGLAFLCVFGVVALVLLPLAIVFGADITPGYTFTSGEANVTHTKLNNLGAGTIATTFYSGKSSAGSDPTPGNYTMIALDSVSGNYHRATLSTWFFDHSGLLANRTVKTTPSLTDTIFINEGGAYKQISETNLFYGGSSFTEVTNSTRLGGVLHGGVFGSLTFSNLMAGLSEHSTPTNGDRFMVLTENGRAVLGMDLETLVAGQTEGTNYSGDSVHVTFDGTRLRSTRGTNLINGVVVTNTVPTSNDAWVVLQDGQLKKLFFGAAQDFFQRGSMSVTQTVYNVATNLNPGGSWTTITNLVASITPRSVSSKVLVRVVLTSCATGNSQPGMMRGLKTTGGDTPLGVGDSDGASRTEASSPIVNSTEPVSTVFEYLDSPGLASNVVYTAQVFATASTTIYINRTSGDANSANSIRGVSTITLTEVYR